jgi:FkbM family methyltransferase
VRPLTSLRARLFWLLHLRHPGRTSGLTRLGSHYGGWWVPADRLGPGTVAYCIGAGEDITFDLELLRRGCTVRTADPTPRAIAHVASLAIDDPNFSFHPVGIWNERTTLRFHAPRNPNHVSHSVVNLQGTTEYFEAEVVTLADMMASCGDDRIDLLKLDIEGAEQAVLDWLVASDLRPEILCVEFDQPQPIRRSRATLRRLVAAGYRVRRFDGPNCLLVRADGSSVVPDDAT